MNLRTPVLRNASLALVALLAVLGLLWFFLRETDPDVREVKMIAEGLNASALTQSFTIDTDAKKLTVVLSSAAHVGMFGPSDISTYLCDTFASQRSVDARQGQAKLRDNWELMLQFEDGTLAGNVRLKRCLEGEILPAP